jgi:hypothetical protein
MHTSVGQLFSILKNHQFQFSKYFKIKESLIQFFEKNKSRIKELLVPVISKNLKEPNDFHLKKSSKELDASSTNFFYPFFFLRTTVIHQNWSSTSALCA